jgi:hypothetical protein
MLFSHRHRRPARCIRRGHRCTVGRIARGISARHRRLCVTHTTAFIGRARWRVITGRRWLSSCGLCTLYSRMKAVLTGAAAPSQASLESATHSLTCFSGRIGRDSPLAKEGFFEWHTLCLVTHGPIQTAIQVRHIEPLKRRRSQENDVCSPEIRYAVDTLGRIGLRFGACLPT